MLAPWHVPVPVRTSSFVPLDLRHGRYNVQVDLRQIAPFDVARPGGHPLLYADLQEDPGTTRLHRLGSGRSGLYRGKYLKGVGRTLLAANWSDAADSDYNTGHLMASGGIREFIVSTYLEARGCASAVHGVEGILVKRITPALRAETREIVERLPRAERREGGWKGDCALQAITIKAGGFVRYSNLIWLLNRLDFTPESPLRADEFFALLNRACDPGAAPAAPPPAPAEIVVKLRRSIERGIDHFRRAWRAGVTWWSVHNNFSIDGRFIDLESPVIVGRPLVGIVASEPLRVCLAPSRAAGTGLFEVLDYVRFTRSALRHICGRLAMLRRNPPMRGATADYLAELIREIEALERGGHPLFSSDVMGDQLWTWVVRDADPPAAGPQLRRAIRACCGALLHERRSKLAELRVRPYTLRLARLDLGWRPVAHVLDAAAMPERADDAAATVNDLIHRLERITDVDRLLHELDDARATIRRLYASDARPA